MDTPHARAPQCMVTCGRAHPVHHLAAVSVAAQDDTQLVRVRRWRGCFMLAEQRAVVEVLKHSCCAVPVPAGLHPLRRVFDLVDEGLRSVFEEALDVIQQRDVAHNVALADVSLDDGDGGDGLAQVAELLLLRAQTLEVVVVAAEDVGNSVRRRLPQRNDL